MSLPAAVANLIETFSRNQADYLKPGYKEQQLRQQFLDPFFESLGWDMANRQGFAEAYKDVIHEDALKIGGEMKAPDYAFRIGPMRKFFVEAKKPSVNLKDDPKPAYQLRRYSWSAKLPLGILTDFQEFAVYDTRIRPKAGDKASVARLLHIRYEDYGARWGEIADLFSKDAVLKGSFDKFATSKRGKRGTTAVDDDFLRDIEHWRDLLARNLALRNDTLTQRELNFAVQRILDRIIFLRIAEDRGIEPLGRLQGLTAGSGIHPRLQELFAHADVRYNSGLFHFAKDSSRDETPDNLTPNLTIDDATLREIIGALYYPQSPYAFNAIPADILGHVYEQFLGKVIRLTNSHRAVVEEKPEVRKAGGVYYTPTYIVDYIVRQTLAPLTDGKTPGRLETLRVLDPACGSGSFLLGAFDYLLNWYLTFYQTDDPQRWAKRKRLYEVAPNAHGIGHGDGNWQLTTAERKRILTTHLFGVDIDAQAVEVTKLSLLLKVLEGEALELQGQTRDFFRVLPDLGKNVQCGNSLVGHDFYDQPNLPQLDIEERLRINTFDWTDGFPAIMAAGGFDAVIGNPPYIRIQNLQENQPEAAAYLNRFYASAAKGNYDIYVCFVERALALLNKSGRLGYILPHKFFNADYGQGLRGCIADGRHLAKVTHFGHQQIFDNATTYTCVLVLSKLAQPSFEFQAVSDLAAWRTEQTARSCQIESRHVTDQPWNFGDQATRLLRARLMENHPSLGSMARIFQGLVTGADNVFVVPTTTPLEIEWTRPFLTTGELRPYGVAKASANMIFPYRVDDSATLVPWAELVDRCPLTAAHFENHRVRLENRERGKWQHDRWYAFGRSQNLTQMAAPKLVIQVTALRPTVIRDDLGLFMTGGGSGPFYGLRPTDDRISLNFLLGIANSQLFGWFVRSQSTSLRGGYVKFSKQYIESAPIPIPPEQERGKLESLVDQMLQLHRDLDAAQTPQERTLLERQIKATDRRIDQMVYQLYGLSTEEVALVESAAV